MSTPVTLSPWFDLSKYGITLLLIRGENGRSWLLAQGAVADHAEALTTIGLRPNPRTPSSWYRPFAADAQLNAADVMKAFPDCKGVLLPRSQFILQSPSDQGNVAVTPLPAHVPVADQRSEVGRCVARLLSQAGVAVGGEAPQVRVFGDPAPRVRVQCWVDQRTPLVRIERLGDGQFVEAAVVAAVDGSGQWHLRGGAMWSATQGYRDGPDPLATIAIIRALISSGAASGSPLFVASYSALDTELSDGLLGRMIPASTREGDAATCWVTALNVAAGRQWMDVTIEDALGRPRLRFAGVERTTNAIEDQVQELLTIGERHLHTSGWLPAMMAPKAPRTSVRTPTWIEDRDHDNARSPATRTDTPGDAVGSSSDAGPRSTDVAGGSGAADGATVAGRPDGDDLLDAGRTSAAVGDAELRGTPPASVGAHGPGEGTGAREWSAVAGRDAGRRRRLGGTGARRGRDNVRLAALPDESSFNATRAIEGNLAALRALQRIESATAAQDDADPEDLQTLTRYVGWGGLPGVFGEGDPQWRAYGATLAALVSDVEWTEARASALNAHYTAFPVIDGIWDALTHLGVTEGVGLEPGAGTGRFLARRPEPIAGEMEFVAVEKDRLSARILKALHPRALVYPCSYETAAIPDGSVDFVLGNVPFGAFSVYDPRYRSLRAPIHDYFIVKSLDKLAPGGVMAVITSTGTLDKGGTRAREAMYASADLLGAFRLPNDTFRDNANTTVTTDLLVFRKRLPDDVAQPFDWRDTAEILAADGETVSVNAVFKPDAGRGVVMGWLVTNTGQYGRPVVEAVSRHPRTREDALPVERWSDVYRRVLPAGVHAPIDTPTAAPLLSPEETAARAAREGSYCIVNDAVCCVYEGVEVPLPGLSRLDASRLRLFIPMRDAMREIVDQQLAGCSDEALASIQVRLGQAYDAFVAAHGPVSLSANRRPWIDDPDAMLVLAAEVFDPETKVATRAAVFTERTLGRKTGVARCDSPFDALTLCINELGRVDPQRIQALAEKPWDECREALRGEIFFDPEVGCWDLKARYLAGHIPRKLDIARAAAESDPELSENVSALEARLPRRVTADEIDVTLGSPWISAEIVQEFIGDIFAVSTAVVLHNPHLAQWAIEARKATAPLTWGTQRMDAWRLTELALNGQTPQVWDSIDGADGDQRILNAEQTAIAIEKQKDIRRAFEGWVFRDSKRRVSLEDRYNYLYNGYRSPDYSGLKLRVPGLALGLAYRDHQHAGIARGVLEPSVLLAHPVGFGKTATISGIAMLGRSLGIIDKMAVVTPKNVIYQFAAEIVRFFPNARVLTIRPEDLSPKGRTLFWRRVQVSNPDVILVTPEAFKRLRLPREAEVAYIQDELALLDMALAWEGEVNAAASKTGARQNIKRIERVKQGFTSRLQRLLNIEEKDDNRISLRDLGVNAIAVDEAHRYKNLQVVTRERVLGVPTAASQRASDMHAKTRFIQQMGGRVVFATGSAVTNSLAEAFNLQRYLMPEEMEAQGVSAFDAWKAQYGHVVGSLEPDPGGRGYRTVMRLAEIRNVPELVAMLGQVIDAVADDGEKVGGRPDPVFTTISVEPSEAQSLYRDVLAERVIFMRRNPNAAKEAGDNVLVVLGDARRASLDLRAQFPKVPAAASGSKLAVVADTIMEVYHRTHEVRGAQAVFLDFATPPATAKADRGWNAYDELTALLVERGMPRDEIAWIHDAKTDASKADLFRRVRSGEKRVILGSTEKMGEGTNMQERMAALHHLNAPHHPGHIVQRNGRGVRFGNLFEKVGIYTYVTRGLLEDWAWHLVTLKNGFIQQMFEGLAAHRDGEGLARRIVDDGTAMSFAEIEAHASDNPLVKDKARADERVQRLELLERADGQDRGTARRELASEISIVEFRAEEMRVLERFERTAEAFESDEAAAVLEEARERQRSRAARIRAQEIEQAGDDKARVTAAEAGFKKRLALIEEETFAMRVNGHAELGRVAAGKVLVELTDSRRMRFGRATVAVFRGAEVVAEAQLKLAAVLTLVCQGRKLNVSTDASDDPVGIVRRIERMHADAMSRRDLIAGWIAAGRERIGALQVRVDQPWPHAEELRTARDEQRHINLQLAAMNKGVEDQPPGTALYFFEQAIHEAGGELNAPKARAGIGTKAPVFDEFDFESFQLAEKPDDDDESERVGSGIAEDEDACDTEADGDAIARPDGRSAIGACA